MIIIKLLLVVFLYYLIKNFFDGGNNSLLALLFVAALSVKIPYIEIEQIKGKPGFVDITVDEKCTIYEIPEYLTTDKTKTDELLKIIDARCGYTYGE